MFGPTRYIQWSSQFYGLVRLDLATSGMPLATLATPPDLADPSAYKRLREAIAGHNRRPTEDVVPCLGTSQGIFLAYAATLSAGDNVLVEAPGYEPLTRTAEGLGVNVRTFERPEGENFRVLPERVAAAMTARTRLVAVTSLHNPSGRRIDDATLVELSKIAGARGGHLLVDEVYASFDDLEPGRTARSLADNVIAISSLTKCYGLGLQRVGWLLGPPDIVASAEAALLSTCGHLPVAHANIGAQAFAELPRLAAHTKASLGEKRAMARAWTAKVGAHWSDPCEGLFGFCSIPGRGDLRQPIETAAKAGVLVAPGVFFGQPNGFRLSWATTTEAEFAAGLALLETQLF